MKKRLTIFSVILTGLWLALPPGVRAQFGFPQPAAPVNGRATAPLDLTGYWVSVVTEDWRWRLITPDKGDYAGVPLNSEGRRVADAWNPAKDEANGGQCKAYGAPAIMRVPTRLHITWDNDTTLRVETDAGKQTRLFHFVKEAPAAENTGWQGHSFASWEGLRPAGLVVSTVLVAGATPQGPEGYLRVLTTNSRPGYLRKNGVPYSGNAVVEEYFDSFKEPSGDTWLVLTSIVTDPQYLYEPFILSSHFKKQTDASGWNPTPCEPK